MALPPKGDPSRPLHLAAGSSRLLGILLTLLGLLALAPLFLMRQTLGSTRLFLLQGVLAMLFYLGPGALYIVGSVFIVKRRNWAVITSLVLTSLFLLMLLLAMVGMGIGILANWDDIGVGEWVATGAILLLIVAFTQHIIHLAQCFGAIRVLQGEMMHGFEPIRVQPVQQPMAPTGESDATSAQR